MKEIKFYRANEYVNNAINIDVYANNIKNVLPSDSSVKVTLDDEVVMVYAKYWWLSSKKIKLNPAENHFTVQVVPFFSDVALVVIAITLITLFVLTNMYQDILLFDYAFLFCCYAFLATFIFIFTIGRDFYFKLKINTHHKDKH